MKRLSVIGILVLLMTMVPYFSASADTPMDYPIPNGYFFKQANGSGGAGETGYPITNDGGVNFWTWFQAFGGVPQVGYPSSNRFVWKNFIVQSTQKVVFQWRPESNSVAFVNVFDELSAAGKDDWLLAVRSVPKAFDWSSDSGKPWDQVMQSHLALLDQNPAIKQAYYSVSDPINMNGLPMATADYGNVFVVRAQRKVFQQWKVAMPWAAAGEVTVANGGDVGKEAGLYPAEAITPAAYGSAPATVTPSPTCPGAPVISSFSASAASITVGQSVTLNWGAVSNATSVSIDNGIGAVATPGSATVSPAASTTYRLTANGCGGTATSDIAVAVVAAPVVTMPVPTQSTPANGAVLRVFPRVATFTWTAVAAPVAGGVTYGIEIQYNNGSWVQKALVTGLAANTYDMTAFPGDNPGRWRVWSSNPTLGDSAKSDWFTFSFKTGAAQYSGTWLNDNPATNGITKIIISNAGQTLTVHPYGQCSPTDCDWGSKSGVFGGEPFVITFPGPPAHQLTITLNNDAGTSLKVVSVGPTTFTNYFHK